MSLDFFRHLNYLDIFILILTLRICYIALKTGLPVELFKLAGILSAIFVSLHYYVFLSGSMRKNIDLGLAPFKIVDFLIFIFLAIAGYLLFMLLRCIFYRFIKLEAVASLSKWGGLVLGAFRCFFMAGLICFTLLVSGSPYLNKSVENSFFGSRIYRVAPDTYRWLWNTIFSKFMGSEESNKTTVTAIHNFFHR
ncbi:CvpA family protein [bacterium]|nr:MAG: CvpA family protein [bacterium]